MAACLSRSLFALLSLLLAAATWALPQKRGDLDGDGLPTVLDVARIINHVTGAVPLLPELAPFADVNEDGRVNDADAALVVEAILGRAALPQLKDQDGDGIPDLIEPLLGLDPTKKDSDGNGVADGDEDYDQDCLKNSAEVALAAGATAQAGLRTARELSTALLTPGGPGGRCLPCRNRWESDRSCRRWPNLRRRSSLSCCRGQSGRR